VNESIRIFTDGGSRGNPGPAAGGYFLTHPQGRIIEGKGVFLGEATNNVAEYNGLIAALEAATRLGARQLEILTDSDLMVRQILGKYRVKNEGLKPLHARCIKLLAGFPIWKIQHIPREKNTRADQIVNQALDRGADYVWKPSKHTVADWGGKRIRLGVLIRSRVSIGRGSWALCRRSCGEKISTTLRTSVRGWPRRWTRPGWIWSCRPDGCACGRSRRSTRAR
jgi:ribonuclease HI